MTADSSRLPHRSGRAASDAPGGQTSSASPSSPSQSGPSPSSPLPLKAKAGLEPAALFADASSLDEHQTTQWLGHVQRLASTGLLVGGMAHDLAGLITPLLGEAERVLLVDDPQEYRQALVKVREWARRSEEYVRALIDLVRRDESSRSPVSVEAVVESTLALLESTKKMAGVSIRRNLDNHHEALVDRTRLMQAVVNLVTNGVRASREGGHEVEVTVRGWRGWVVIEVADNGAGVPKEIEDRIFEPFVGSGAGSEADAEGGPAARSSTGSEAAAALGASTPAGPASAPRGREPGRDRAGTGLGLYITKRLIEEQGGRIEFETERGVGSVFRIMLEPAPSERPSRGTSAAGRGN